MKTPSSELPEVSSENAKIIIVLPYFNDGLGQRLLEKTQDTLLENKVKKENIELIRVAGALEMPYACQKAIKDKSPDVVIALGIVIRGETTHYELVTETSHQGLMQVQLQEETPIVFGILSCENVKQAEARIEEKSVEFAKTALIQTTL